VRGADRGDERLVQQRLEPAGISAGTASVMLVLTMLAGVVACGVVPAAVARRRQEGPAMVTGLLVATVSCLLLAIAPSVLTGFVSLAAIGLVLLPNLPIILELVDAEPGTPRARRRDWSGSPGASARSWSPPPSGCSSTCQRSPS
jgi:MFS family permease